MTTTCNLYILPPVDHAADEQTRQVYESIRYHTGIYQSPGLVEDTPVRLLNHSVHEITGHKSLHKIPQTCWESVSLGNNGQVAQVKQCHQQLPQLSSAYHINWSICVCLGVNQSGTNHNRINNRDLSSCTHRPTNEL